MYDYLEGSLVHKNMDSITLDVHGVGYHIHVLKGFYEEVMGTDGVRLRLYVHGHSLEEKLHLYGFLRREERDFFKLLVSVSGVGPALGVKILSNTSYDEVARRIMHDDKESLLAVSGLGPKTAAKILLELKDKVSLLEIGMSDKGISGSSVPSDHMREIIFEARQALSSLGYKEADINKVIVHLSKTFEPDETVENFLRRTLAYLSQT